MPWHPGGGISPKRARVELGVDEAMANQAMMEVKAELEFHAAAWRKENLGGLGELQPQGSEREAELPGDHTTSVDSSGRHIMVDGSERESLARLAGAEADDLGRKLVYSSARMIVRLGPTPSYQTPVCDASVRIEDGAPEGVVVAAHVPRFMSWGYATNSEDHTREGHTVQEVTMQHTQYEHHLMERVEALTAKMAD